MSVLRGDDDRGHRCGPRDFARDCETRLVNGASVALQRARAIDGGIEMSGRSFGPDDRERLDFAERLYEEARSRPAAERQELISRACVGDDGLREQLDRLLRNAE